MTSHGAKKKKQLFLISGVFVIINLLFFFLVKISNEISQKNSFSDEEKDTPHQIPPAEEDDCPYNEESLLNPPTYYGSEIAFKIQKEDLLKWRNIRRDFVVKLWKKGYHWHDILQLWGWKLEEKDIPDLKTNKRIGVINSLYKITYHPSIFDRSLTEEEIKKILEEGSGELEDLVVIIRKTSTGKPVINIGKGIVSTIPHNRKGETTKDYYEKVINFTLKQENINLHHHEVSILNCFGSERFGKEPEIAGGNCMGKSTGSAIYLALLSALQQRPISNKVAAAGNLTMNSKKGKINDQEINLPIGTNLPIGGLKEKVIACNKKGVNRLVLSKYQTSPNLLNKKNKRSGEWILANDYQQVIQPEIKEKMQVDFAENIKELRELFFSGKLT